MLETVRIMLLLLPTIIEVVKKLEELFPDSGLGKMKFALIRDMLISVDDISNDYIPYIEKTVNVVVGVFNQFGVFKK